MDILEAWKFLKYLLQLQRERNVLVGPSGSDVTKQTTNKQMKPLNNFDESVRGHLKRKAEIKHVQLPPFTDISEAHRVFCY